MMMCMHAPDDDMYRQMVLDDDVQAQNFVEKLLTPDDKCRLVLNLRFAPPITCPFPSVEVQLQ